MRPVLLLLSFANAVVAAVNVALARGGAPDCAIPAALAAFAAGACGALGMRMRQSDE